MTYSCRGAMVPIHASLGLATFLLAIASCISGLTQKAIWTLEYVFDTDILFGCILNCAQKWAHLQILRCLKHIKAAHELNMNSSSLSLSSILFELFAFDSNTLNDSYLEFDANKIFDESITHDTEKYFCSVLLGNPKCNAYTEELVQICNAAYHQGLFQFYL